MTRVVLWATAGCGPREEQNLGHLPNILLISLDACRADHLSCYGYPHKTTPHIDAVARDGVLFERAQSTNSITLPSHCSMLTGTIPPYHGAHVNRAHLDDASNLTFAEVLQANGYHTGAVVGAVVTVLLVLALLPLLRKGYEASSCDPLFST